MSRSTLARSIGAAALLPALFLSACGPANRSLNSVHQPVVSRDVQYLDLAAGDTLSRAEGDRLNAWLTALRPRPGDDLIVHEGSGAAAFQAGIAAIAARHGLGVSLERNAWASVGPAGARVMLRRTTAAVPGCPDWRRPSQPEFAGSTMSNYGCATNSNLAAMVADPDDLIEGKADNASDARTINRAIGSYREGRASGEAGLTQTDTQSGGGGQ